MFSHGIFYYANRRSTSLQCRWQVATIIYTAHILRANPTIKQAESKPPYEKKV